jgi:hypothetical protein
MIPHRINREQDIRDCKGQEYLVAAAKQPSIPALITPF